VLHSTSLPSVREEAEVESSRVIFNADDFGRSPTIDEVVIRALPPTSIPHLVDSSGRFRDEPARAGFLYFFSRTAREELSREIAAQFQMFDTTGLPLSHVDGHLNIHLHPAVLSLAPPLAVKHGARGLRLPRDDIRLSLRLRRGGAAGKVALTLTFAILTRRAALVWVAGGLGRHVVWRGETYALERGGHIRALEPGEEAGEEERVGS